MTVTNGSVVVADGSNVDAATWTGGHRIIPRRGLPNEYIVVVDGTNGAAAAWFAANKAPVNGIVPNGTAENATITNAAPINAVSTNGTVENKTATASAPTTQWIDTVPALSKAVDTLTGLPAEPPSIYVDLEGHNLSRYGTISILQVHVHPTNTTYLIDVQSLGNECFSTAGQNGWTLKRILESPLIPKVFFDVRSDSDALFVLFGISLFGVLDLQLMEFATRPHHGKKMVKGLGNCVLYDSPLPQGEKLRWEKTKQQGRDLFAPESGGSFQVFNKRPLEPVILEYCAQDVSVMPCLWAHYDSKMTEQLKQEVITASKERVWESHAVDYISKGRHMTLAPLSLIHASTVDDWWRSYNSWRPRHDRCPSSGNGIHCCYYCGKQFGSAADAADTTS